MEKVATDLEAAQRQNAEKDATVQELQRRVAALEALTSTSDDNAMVAQVQEQEALIAMLQRQCAEKDTEIKKLQKKNSAKDLAAQKKEAVRTAVASHLTWKTCHSLRAR